MIPEQIIEEQAEQQTSHWSGTMARNRFGRRWQQADSGSDSVVEPPIKQRLTRSRRSQRRRARTLLYGQR